MSERDDEQASPEELAEAAELARVLDGGGLVDAPGEALEAASLLRVSLQPELEEARQQEILSELIQKRKHQPRSAPGWLRWIWLAVPATAGAVALWQASGIEPETAFSVAQKTASEAQASEMAAETQAASVAEKASTTATARALPEPSRKLLQLQAQALKGKQAKPLTAFDREMNSYRGEVLAVLEARYR